MPLIFYVGIKGLIVSNNKVLLLKSKSKIEDNYFWDLPGGRMENNETIQEALERELAEELPGITNIKVHNLIDVYKLPKQLPDGTGLMQLIYRVNASINDVMLSNEHCDFRWVEKDQLETIEKEAVLNPTYKTILLTVLNV